jgi:hypothetical protein
MKRYVALTATLAALCVLCCGLGCAPCETRGSKDISAGCADEDGDGFVAICHRPPGNPDNSRTLTVSVDAAAAHLEHGDSCGPCQ